MEQAIAIYYGIDASDLSYRFVPYQMPLSIGWVDFDGTATPTPSGEWHIDGFVILTYKVTFEFKSLAGEADGTTKALPQEVLDLLPAPMTDLAAGTDVTFPTLATTEVPAEGGKWVFTGWTSGTGTTITGSVLESGGWRFDKNPPPVTGSVYVKYVAEDGTVLEAEIVVKQDALVGEAYTTEQKTFDGYVFARMADDSAPANGNVEDGNLYVTYVYKAETVVPPQPATGSVYVKYITEDGTVLEAESVVKQDAPVGEAYTTEQKTFDGYVFARMADDSAPANGNVEDGNLYVTYVYKAEETPNPPITPEEKVGNLTVTKMVSGSSGDQNKAFTFTVTLDKKDLSGTYGDMTFTNGVATFTLKHGENKTATGLPAGVSYTVEETDNSGYTVTKANATGTIQTGITATAAFENYKGSSSGSGGGGGGGGGSSHTPQAARVTLTATKTLDGQIPTGSGFTFFLDDANGHRLQAKNNQGNNITFDILTFDQTGTYVYYLTEQTGNDKNVNYDAASYKVTVTVTCPYDYEANVSYEKNGQAYHGVPAFSNTTKSVPQTPDTTPTGGGTTPAPGGTTPAVTPAASQEGTPSRPLDTVPKTGDTSNLGLWGILAACSALSLAVLVLDGNRRKIRYQGKHLK